MTPPDFSTEARRKIRVPRPRARFQLSIRDWKVGDSLTLSLSPLPWRGVFLDAVRRRFSSSQLARTLTRVLNSAWD